MQKAVCIAVIYGDNSKVATALRRSGTTVVETPGKPEYHLLGYRPERTNFDRAERAREVLAFADIDISEETISDLVADLMHLADRLSPNAGAGLGSQLEAYADTGVGGWLSFEYTWRLGYALAENAKSHYEAEVREEYEGPLDFESSASRQHFIDTGYYLCKGETNDDTEPYCNHDAVAVRQGVCECGTIVDTGAYLRAKGDLR